MDKTFEILFDDFYRRVQAQETPVSYTKDDYIYTFINGVKALYIDLGIAEDFSSDFDRENLAFNRVLSLTEEEYIVVSAMIHFYQIVQQDVNTIVGYSTDSLTLTNADKPYANLSEEIKKLSLRQTELFWKLRAERGD